jgi:formylglycine-generating enzyme required for sulfatase activity
MTRFAVVWLLSAGAASMAFAQPADRATPGIEETDPASIEAATPAEPEPPATGPADGAAALAARLDDVDLQAVRLAVTDMIATFGAGYPKGDETLAKLDEYARALPGIREALKRGDASAVKAAEELLALKRRALLANPLLNFEKLLVIRRKCIGGARRSKGEGYGLGQFLGLPRQSSWQQDNIPDVRHWDNDIAVVDPRVPDGEVRTLYRPAGGLLVGDLELNFDARRLLFSMPDAKLRWQVYEAELSGARPRQVTPSVEGNVHNYDACYLPNGRIAFVSTAPLQGVPCNASVNVGMLYATDADGQNTRQLCFDQDHNYCPTVMNNGQLLYLRWEYTDIPHVWGRYLFTMNPDGTSQREYYGSGAYWPNSIFYTRPIPGHPTRLVGIVTGHHVGRVGEMVLLDPAAGQSGNQGVIQRIPGRGKPVKPIILDRLTEDSWPKCLHPYPLAEARTNRGAGRYFLVAAKPRPGDLWGIYLADVFDNFTLVAEQEGYALLEPIPVLPRPAPPVIADRVDLSRKDAVMYIEDVYEGPGLAGVPRGSVKQLRLFTYHFAYQRMAGISHYVGADGPWEPRRVLGTVGVEPDGSAMFRVPANTPISIQPLDADGQALQLMRSWTTAMPGEIVSCSGCHERRTDSAPIRKTLALTKPVVEIEPWHGPVRPFSFAREVQPVLDKYCTACHDGSARPDGKTLPDLRAQQGRLICLVPGNPELRVVSDTPARELLGKYGGVFEPSFIELRRFVRVGGFESDIRLLNPGEFAADTSELVQMLRKGHHGVKLDDEAWRRLETWIDLNAPCHGTWSEITDPRKTEKYHDSRMQLRKLYAGLDGDPETYPEAAPAEAAKPIVPAPEVLPPAGETNCPGWPFDPAEARRRQQAAGTATRTIDLGGGVRMELVRIPAGEFLMGDANGQADERPVTHVRIGRAFWMGRLEVTNRQYGLFDPSHESRFEHKGSWSFSEHHLGWPLDTPAQPVVRVSWDQAKAFCRWLCARSGLKVDLPTEAQWEYACRAGSAAAMSYGNLDANFAQFANMSDATMRELAYDTDGRYTSDITPRDSRFNDGKLVTADAGSFSPNAWGLRDMHGNAWEWVRSAYAPYPYADGNGRNADSAAGPRVVRGGSWRDRPARCRSAYRLSYPSWRRVYNVGFRVILED